jgi:hypothetical protein
MNKWRPWAVCCAVWAVSWAALAYVVNYTDPEISVHRLAFLVLLFLASLTTVSPLAYLLHLRFAGDRSYRRDVQTSFREGGLAALFLVLCTWLRMGDALNWVNALLLLSALALVEVFTLAKGS